MLYKIQTRAADVKAIDLEGDHAAFIGRELASGFRSDLLVSASCLGAQFRASAELIPGTGGDVRPEATTWEVRLEIRY